MRFEGKGIAISREAAINAVKEVLEKTNTGIKQVDPDDVIEALEELAPIAFLCDRKACEKCSYPTCKHTANMNHAKNFVRTDTVIFMEKER